MFDYSETMKRTQWFRDARLGTFIHFGLYSIPARGEWIRSIERISINDYQKYFDEFNPSELDTDDWMRTAKRSGSKYVVLTAKHHDGFCLFDSSLTDYTVTKTPYGKDIIADYVEAARRHGLKVGIYYSLVDWHHQGYPVLGDRQHPERDNPEWTERERNWESYLEYLHGQVRELCSNYGKIDLLWFDFSYWKMKGEVWQGSRLMELIRSLQPEIVVNNRLGGIMWDESSAPYTGDFAGPEQMIPRKAVRDFQGRPLPWESCITLNDSWGYRSVDQNWKDSRLVVQSLINCVSKGGNLLVNLGPDALGRIPQKAIDIMDDMGDWIALNGASIYGCGESEFEVPEWGFFTQNGKSIFAHVLRSTVGHLCLPGLAGRVESARLLADGSEVPTSVYWNSDAEVEVFGEDGDLYANFSLPLQRSYSLPDERSTVIQLELNK